MIIDCVSHGVKSVETTRGTENDSNDSEDGFDFMEKATTGMDIAEES